MRAAFLLCLLAACVPKPHVRLEAPRADAPSGERVAAYERLEPRVLDQTMIYDEHHNLVQSTNDSLLLGDGQRIYHAEDLEPVVAANSLTARAARRSRDAGARIR